MPREALGKAAGLDGWAPNNWKYLGASGAKWLMVLFALVEKRGDARFRIGDVLDVNDPYACRTGAFNRSLYGGKSRLGIPQRKLPAGKVIILDVDE
jgi:hypothetical protein